MQSLYLVITPNSKESLLFAISTIFFHWCFTPYALYTLPSILFSYMYYNKKKSNSLSSIVTPLVGDWGLVIQVITALAVIHVMINYKKREKVEEEKPVTYVS